MSFLHYPFLDWKFSFETDSNSADPIRTPQNAASELGPHGCLKILWKIQCENFPQKPSKLKELRLLTWLSIGLLS